MLRLGTSAPGKSPSLTVMYSRLQETSKEPRFSCGKGSTLLRRAKGQPSKSHSYSSTISSRIGRDIGLSRAGHSNSQKSNQAVRASVNRSEQALNHDLSRITYGHVTGLHDLQLIAGY